MKTTACDGCGQDTPYEAGQGDEFPTYGEWLATPLGNVYARTHRRRECVQASRARHGGRRIDEPLSAAERLERATA